MTTVTIPLTKRFSVTTSHGSLAIEMINDSYHVTYHNPLYKGSPFKIGPEFSTQFTYAEIVKSREIQSALCRFLDDGEAFV